MYDRPAIEVKLLARLFALVLDENDTHINGILDVRIVSFRFIDLSWIVPEKFSNLLCEKTAE